MFLPPAEIKKISEAICLPEGSWLSTCTSTEAFSDSGRAQLIFEVPAKGHYFRLDRTENRALRFFHSSPGTGTRLAEICLEGLPDFSEAFLGFTWSPEKTNFYCRPKGMDMLSSEGAPSPISFRVASDGSVFQIGDSGVQVMSVRVRVAGQAVLTPTAIELWDATINAIDLLWTGKSDQGFIFEVLQANSTLSMLATGLETYAQTRLKEIESEGNGADVRALFEAFSSIAARSNGQFDELVAKSTTLGMPVLHAVLDHLNINFQDFDQLKRSFKAAYGIRIGQLGIDSNSIAELRKLIRYRHRVIHVSPTLAILNEESTPEAPPVFSNHSLAVRATGIFQNFVKTLHQATMQLRPDRGVGAGPLR
ncbi:hypothetical protein [Pseudoxanthomonas mexicana]|uniref:hypothetical protein n=1 Tax=Pseudoxanthomonas mexicana TaxID=128785 RepID=UPI0020A16156|nr:hypothetical protein [Pseudoxanthomonas mexicana]MCP1584081.1 uncharacterized protein YukE [Pseudoxanthomonas mexicana]